MTVEQVISEPKDQFPIENTMLLETLLRRCQHHVLSANGDSKLVMKGITHGAHYFDPKDQNSCDNQDKNHHGSGEGGEMENSNQNAKLNIKRKDQDEDEDEDEDEERDDKNGHDNEHPSTQKKPRVVWSVELHHKFVAAVNQLGIYKDVPKKILDLMNIENLKKEDVAKHLRKYRFYLKRISRVNNQQANMVEALGRTDASYLLLSTNGDSKLVMNGITHEALYYFYPNDRNGSDNQDKIHQGSGEVGGLGNSDQNVKLNKKRKDRDEDENGHDNEDPSTQKKPRFVWSVEMHRKFFAAISQLDIDKAVPKKILDLMNVEKLTLENVSSHLQEYKACLARLGIKGIICMAN